MKLSESFNLKDFLRKNIRKQQDTIANHPAIFQKGIKLRKNRPTIIGDNSASPYRFDRSIYKDMQDKAKNKKIADYFNNPLGVLSSVPSSSQYSSPLT